MHNLWLHRCCLASKYQQSITKKLASTDPHTHQGGGLHKATEFKVEADGILVLA